ncbi:MAG: hypothetical protein DWH99_03390 [Planctomycetota bacterium]|nr:MAG: hypothetical protein DWH99_03390 [Planctomycetota bacterium]
MHWWECLLENSMLDRDASVVRGGLLGIPEGSWAGVKIAKSLSVSTNATTLTTHRSLVWVRL